MRLSGPVRSVPTYPPVPEGEKPRGGAAPLRLSEGLLGGPAPETAWASPTRAAPAGPGYGASEWSALGSHRLDFLLVVLFAVVLRAPSLSLSVFGSADESAFILAAREVLQGHLPHLTLWDHKPPGSTLLIAAAMAVFGQSVEAARLLGMLCVVATAWLLYAITRRVSPGRFVPLAAALLYVAFSTRLNGGIATITETIFAPFTAAGILLLLTAPDKRGGGLGLVATFAAAGLAFGIAVWIKYVPALPAALAGGVALIALLLQRKHELGRIIACGAAFAAGVLLPTAASVAFYWWMGALDAFWSANFGFAATYVTNAAFGDHPRGAFFYALRSVTLVVVDIWPLLAAAAAAFLPHCLGRLFGPGRSYPSAMVVAWLAGEVLAVTAQMKFYVYHFLPLLPPLCVLSAVAIREHAGRLAQPHKAALLAALVVAFAAIGPVAVHARTVAAALFRPDVPREIAKLVAAEMRPGDQLFIINYESIIYFLADAPLPTRFPFPVLLTGPHMSVSPVDPRAELRRVLHGKPRFLIFNTSWRDAPVVWDPELMLLVEETVARDYAPHATWTLPESVGTVRLFTLND